jgi:hypothetical protein
MKELNKSIINIRVKLQNAKLKKSGKNKFAGFEYFELADFLPKLNELMLEEEINDRFYINENMAVLELIKGEASQIYTIPFTQFDTPVNKQGQTSMQDIQYLGALNTYYKRYLYLNAFGITDGEVIDSLDNNDLQPNVNYKELLMNRLKELNIDVRQYAIENKVSAKTTQARAKELLESLQ